MMQNSFAKVLIASAVFPTLWAFPLSAQQPATPVFKSETRLVLVDSVVTDKKGKRCV